MSSCETWSQGFALVASKAPMAHALLFETFPLLVVVVVVDVLQCLGRRRTSYELVLVVVLVVLPLPRAYSDFDV